MIECSSGWLRHHRLDGGKERTSPATENCRELLANPDIDAVMVSATPETTHDPLALEALQAGKHVLLEKPIALTLAEADELITETESVRL